MSKWTFLKVMLGQLKVYWDLIIAYWLYTLLSVPQQSNLPWPPPFSLQSRLSERLRDLSAKNWSQLAGSGPVPWKQAPSLFNPASSSDRHSEVPSVVEISSVDNIYGNERLPASSLEKKNEDLSGISTNWNVKLGARELMFINGKHFAFFIRCSWVKDGRWVHSLFFFFVLLQECGMMKSQVHA